MLSKRACACGPLDKRESLMVDLNGLRGTSQAASARRTSVNESLTHVKNVGVVWRELRPLHWVKNVFVLAPLVFARRVTDVHACLLAAAAFGGFCLLSSAVYIINDVVDAEQDRRHRLKRMRPVAAGQIPAADAFFIAFICCAIGLTACALVRWPVAIAGVCYVALTLLYTFGLRRWMVVDVMCIALGFVLRAAAGGLALSVPVSPWLLACTFTLCMFLGFTKRRYELREVEESEPGEQAPAGRPPYDAPLLEQFLSISAGAAIVCYILYAMDARTVHNLGTPALLFLTPLVVYCVFRLLHLVRAGKFSDPTDAITRDAPFLIALALWIVGAVLIATWGQGFAGGAGHLVRR